MNAPAIPKLRRTQLETLRLTAAGYKAGEIAERYDVHRSTVEGSLQTLRSILHARTTAELVARALVFRILDPQSVLDDQRDRRRSFAAAGRPETRRKRA